MNKYQYYKVKKERQEYLGCRVFKVNFSFEEITQVCFSMGEVKKGKSNTPGIYFIHRLTFFSNYFSMGYVEPITKKEYEKYFKKVLIILS